MKKVLKTTMICIQSIIIVHKMLHDKYGRDDISELFDLAIKDGILTEKTVDELDKIADVFDRTDGNLNETDSIKYSIFITSVAISLSDKLNRKIDDVIEELVKEAKGHRK